MGKFNVKINGPLMDIYKYFRERGLGIQEAKEKTRTNPVILNFENFGEFTDCVRHFHMEPFIVEANCDFEHDMSEFVGDNIMSEEDVVEMEDFSNETHLSNIEMINAIIYWQKSEVVPSLLCDNDKEHGALFPGIDTETNTVVLGCDECGYVSHSIPDEIMEFYNSREKIEKDGKN